MKFSRTLGLAAGAFIAIALMTGAGLAKGGKPTVYVLDPADANAEQVCTDLGGTVSVDKNGNKICTLPPGVSAPTTVQPMRESPN